MPAELWKAALRLPTASAGSTTRYLKPSAKKPNENGGDRSSHGPHDEIWATPLKPWTSAVTSRPGVGSPRARWERPPLSKPNMHRSETSSTIRVRIEARRAGRHTGSNAFYRQKGDPQEKIKPLTPPAYS